MSKSIVVTARLEPETLDGLNRLAEYYDRSKAWLVAKAVARYVEEESAFFAFVQAGEASIDRGEGLTQDQMKAWVASLDLEADAA